MRSYDLKIDVTGATGLPGELHMAVTVFLPDQIVGPVKAMFGYPGGGYGRRSSFVSVRVRPRMAHMHNFAHTRRELWDAVEHFARGVPINTAAED